MSEWAETLLGFTKDKLKRCSNFQISILTNIKVSALKIILSLPGTMDSSFFNQQMAPWRPNFPHQRLCFLKRWFLAWSCRFLHFNYVLVPIGISIASINCFSASQSSRPFSIIRFFSQIRSELLSKHHTYQLLAKWLKK